MLGNTGGDQQMAEMVHVGQWQKFNYNNLGEFYSDSWDKATPLPQNCCY